MENAEAAHLNTSNEELREKQVAVSEYDFVRFTIADMNGVLRGALLSGDVAAKFLDSGIGCFSGK